MSESEPIGLPKVIKDLYLGNGKPALTHRVNSLEDAVDRIEETLSEFKRAAMWLIGLVLSAIVLQLVNLVVKH